MLENILKIMPVQKVLYHSHDPFLCLTKQPEQFQLNSLQDLTSSFSLMIALSLFIPIPQINSQSFPTPKSYFLLLH